MHRLSAVLLAVASALFAQAPAARIKIDTDRVIGQVDPRLFGNFAEHLGRCIYGGIWDEGSPLSDADGYRKDVMEATKDLGVTVLRWPGGNFASGYNWKDGIGPRDQRPPRPRRRLGRHRIQSLRHRRFPALLRAHRRRAIHLHQRRARHSGRCAPVGGVHQRIGRHLLGAASAARTAATSPTTSRSGVSATRSTGPGSLGHKNAEDYTKFALEAAKAMRRADQFHQADRRRARRNFRAGSDWVGWNRTVLESLQSEIDYISLHTYIGNTDNNFEKFLAASRDLDDRIEVVGGLIQASRRDQSQAAAHLHRLRRMERLVSRSGRQRIRDRQDAPGGGLQLRGRARHGDVLELLLPPRQHRQNGQSCPTGECDRAHDDQ